MLQITGSSVKLGLIMMTAAIPRAVLMLLGGAVIDRVSARNVLIVTALARAAIVALVAGLASAGLLVTWHLVALALLFGTADAFSLPAASAIMPSVVAPADLQQANALSQGAVMAATMAAPAPAGWTIRRWGVPVALWADAVSFLVMIAALVRLPAARRPAAAARRHMFGAIADGIRYVVVDAGLRNMMLMIGVLNLCTTGPFNVGLPWLAETRFGSATVYGSLLSCFGAGAGAGMVLAGVKRRFRHRGLVLLAIVVVLGAGMPLIGILRSFTGVALVMAAIGLANGFAGVVMTAWMQERVDAQYLGRVMSLLMFAAVGLMPLSLLVSGLVAQAHIAALFIASGGLVVGAGIVGLASGATRSID